MKRATLTGIGLVLALAGGAGLAFGGVPYEDEAVLLDAGPLEASASVEREWTIPPLAAGAVLGLGLVVAGYGVVRRP